MMDQPVPAASVAATAGNRAKIFRFIFAQGFGFCAGAGPAKLRISALFMGPGSKAYFVVDDLGSYVHSEQCEQWVPIAPFAAPYLDTDRELARVTEVLRMRLGLAAR
jgi:hypothetical protein